ncbi:MAG: hypothetical protein FJ304_18025 [Planctomycetes bacterium]|nr:hypothetical protein [Planctomycetota bacterium]
MSRTDFECHTLGRESHCRRMPYIGWHPFVAAHFWPRSDGFLIIDGANLVRHEGLDHPRLEILIAVALEFLRCNQPFLCVFDASVLPGIRQKQGEWYADLYESYLTYLPCWFSEVESGESADLAILELASAFNCPIMTNDRFRQHEKDFPWLSTDRVERLVPFSSVGAHKIEFKLGMCKYVASVPERHGNQVASLFSQFTDLASSKAPEWWEGEYEPHPVAPV